METQFKVDQKVVYPSQGVGTIIEIFDKTFKDKTIPYYKIYIDVSEMIVMVPVEKAMDLGIRQIVTAEEAQNAINLLSEECEPITSDWKLRYQMNLELLKKGTIRDIATIVRCLYNRSKVKELPILERKLYDSSKKLLIDEVAIATGREEKDVENEIHTKLEPLGSVVKIKHAIPLDDEDEDDDLMSDDKSSGSKNDSDDSDDSDDTDDMESDSLDDMGYDDDSDE